MEHFSNQTIDIKQLPRYEEIELIKLNPKYLKVILINILFFESLIIAASLVVTFFVFDDLSGRVYLLSGIGTTFLTALILVFPILGFKKKAFAFREHDVIYQSGIIATNTMIIPYNRVQHVALHEGFLSRMFGLASIEIFTAGGSSSDISISGIQKEEAENIKQLLMGKIQKQL